MNTYEQKLEARKARYEQIADNQRAKSQAEYRKADMSEAATGIPFGQPILVGHHSESKHRNTIKRADNAMRRGIEASKKAKHYAGKAASVGTGGISSDDPEAITKLQAKIDAATELQEKMKATNKALKKGDIAALHAIGYSDKHIELLKTPDFAGRVGVPSYELSNNNANIRRMKQRIEQLKAASQAEHKETEIDGIKVVENVEENRIQLFFPGKPSADVRTQLKSRGFRWSRYNGCWQRHLNNAGRWAAEAFLKTM